MARNRGRGGGNSPQQSRLRLRSEEPSVLFKKKITALWEVFCEDGDRVAGNITVNFTAVDQSGREISSHTETTRPGDGKAVGHFTLPLPTKRVKLRAHVVGKIARTDKDLDLEALRPTSAEAETSTYKLDVEPTGGAIIDPKGRIYFTWTPRLFCDGRAIKSKLHFVSSRPCILHPLNQRDEPTPIREATLLVFADEVHSYRLILPKEGPYHFEVFDKLRDLHKEFNLEGAPPPPRRPSNKGGIIAWWKYFTQGGKP